MSPRDKLFETPQEHYVRYLDYVYGLMEQHVEDDDVVVEVCTREDRGIFSQEIIPHKEYILVDRNPARPGHDIDALTGVLPKCDVLLSTAILHHTPPGDIARLLENLCKNTRRLVMLSGPNVEVMPELLGDHKYHIDVGEIIEMVKSFGFKYWRIERTGLSKPYSEVLLVLERQP